MHPVCRGGSSSDYRDAETARGIGETFGHGDCVVLVPRAVEADARTVERRGKDCGVVAHQAKYLLDAERLDVLDEYLIGRGHVVVLLSNSGPSPRGLLMLFRTASLRLS